MEDKPGANNLGKSSFTSLYLSCSRNLKNLWLDLSVGRVTYLFSVQWLLRPFCRGCVLVNWSEHAFDEVSLKNLERSKKAYALNTLSWNNMIELWSYCVTTGTKIELLACVISN